MRRREFIRLFLMGGVVSMPIAARAQQPDRIVRIGILLVRTAAQEKKFFGDDPFGLHDFGYIEGKNLHIEYRYADGHPDRLPGLVAELVELKVELIVTAAEGVYAAHRATATIPIVMASAGDVVALGIVASLSHPGGNLTGSMAFSPEMMAKRLEMLKWVVPSLSRAGVLLPRDTPSNRVALEFMGRAAKTLNVELLPIEVAGPGDYEFALSAMVDKPADGWVVNETGQFNGDAELIASIARKRSLAAVGGAIFAANGGLLGYGVNLPELYRHAAKFVDKIIKGAKPGDIPIEQATKFATVVNLKTAKAIGVEIPPLLLAGADEVIE